MFTEVFTDSYSFGSWVTVFIACDCDDYLYGLHVELRRTAAGSGGAGSINMSYRFTDPGGELHTETDVLSVGVAGAAAPMSLDRLLTVGRGEAFQIKLEYSHAGPAATGYEGDLKLLAARERSFL